MTTTIMQIADIHFGAVDEAAIAAVHAMEEEIAPDLVLVCGDITQRGRTEEYKDAHAWFKGFASPILAMPGNHDAPYYSPIERLATPYARFEEYVGSLSLPDYIDEHVAILPYNSARAVQASLDWSTGAVDLDDLRKLVTRFKVEAPGRLHMLACHHPMIYPPESPLDKETENGPEALQILSDAGCDAVLTGHIHIPFVKDREPGKTGVLSIGAGTLSTRRRGVESSFNILEIDEEGLSVTAVDFVEGVFTRRASWTKTRDAFS